MSTSSTSARTRLALADDPSAVAASGSSSTSARTRLALADDPSAVAASGPWIGPMLALGTRGSRYAAGHAGRQLVVALSVPQRDFAAALIACGWVMARNAPALPGPLDVLAALAPGTPLRVVTDSEVLLDTFVALNVDRHPARLHLRHANQWLVPKIRAVQVLTEPEAPLRMPRPDPGILGRLAGLEDGWDALLARPTTDLAIVGTKAYLGDDLNAFLRRDADQQQDRTKRLDRDLAKASEKGKDYKVRVGHGALLDVVLPATKRSATWFTRIYSYARFAEQLPLPSDLSAVVLDGSGAIKYIAEIETPVVMCILDRSVADETAAEMVVQLRNTRGEPISLVDDLGWRPPAGVEALGFTVAL